MAVPVMATALVMVMAVPLVAVMRARSGGGSGGRHHGLPTGKGGQRESQRQESLFQRHAIPFRR